LLPFRSKKQGALPTASKSFLKTQFNSALTACDSSTEKYFPLYLHTGLTHKPNPWTLFTMSNSCSCSPFEWRSDLAFTWNLIIPFLANWWWHSFFSVSGIRHWSENAQFQLQCHGWTW
jgi:hypothetical protein